MEMFSLDEYLELERQVRELQHENDILKQELQKLGLQYNALAGRSTNSEDSYREDFCSTDDYLTLLDAVWDRR